MTDGATGNGTRNGRGRLPHLLAIALMSASVAACSGAYRAEIVGAVPTDYRDNHPITITEQLATLDVPVGMETRYLPAGMEDNILGFAGAFMQSGSTELAIVLPDGSTNATAAATIAMQIEVLMVNGGVPPANIQYRSYPSSPGEAAPVRLAYVRIAATTQPCGPWTDNVARNYMTQNYGAFGCATQQNFAAMVANPLDLLYPRLMTPPNAARRSGVLGQYQAGEGTTTQYDDTFTGVAEVGQ